MPDWFDGAGNGTPVDVIALLDSEASKRLFTLVQAGALVSFGVTSDGGALGVTITVDGRWRREYVRQTDQLDLWTEEAMAPVMAALDGKLASSEPRKRQRGARRL